MHHIFLASVQEVPDDFETRLEKFSEQRRAKVLRCKNLMDKKRSYLAGRLLSHAAEEEGIEETFVCLAPYDWESIRQQGSRAYYANISHSGDYAAVVISDEPVGVDMEQYGARYGGAKAGRSIEMLARKVLNEAEYAAYRSFFTKGGRPDKTDEFIDEKDFFLKIWTRKEAYAKWDGKGIALDFSGIDALCEDVFYSRKICLKERDFLWLSVYPFLDNMQNVSTMQETICHI